jgi:hypothetical protein
MFLVANIIFHGHAFARKSGLSSRVEGVFKNRKYTAATSNAGKKVIQTRLANMEFRIAYLLHLTDETVEDLVGHNHLEGANGLLIREYVVNRIK